MNPEPLTLALALSLSVLSLWTSVAASLALLFGRAVALAESRDRRPARMDAPTAPLI